MNRKTWLTVGLSLLVGTGIGTTLPGVVRTSASAESPAASVNSVRAQTQLIRWGDASGEQGEIESPRWGDAGTEKGEIEAPRWGDAGTEKGEIEAPRGHDQITDGDPGQAPHWGDTGTEKGELEAPRA
jgi:hypothetical protein